MIRGPVRSALTSVSFRDTLPKTFLLENVPGLAYQKKSEGLELILKAIWKINRDCGTSYSIAVQKLNAASYGVPQLRERVFVVGARDGKEICFPAPTHVDPAQGRYLLARRPTDRLGCHRRHGRGR